MRMHSVVLASLITIGLLGAGCGSDDPTPGDCSPTTCAGCCQNGQCILQINELTCGIDGANCQSCPIGQLCDLMAGICKEPTSACGPSTCAGGCCYNGQCVQPGNYPYACGTSGQQCQQCTGSDQCLNGVCGSGTGACSPANCTGCCHGDTCVIPATNTQCGAGGAPCVPCPSGYNCDLQVGQCVQGSDCSGCTTGCCLNNICYPGTSPAACGSGGATCESCESNEVCTSGGCQAASEECNISNCWGGCCTTTGCVLNGSYNDSACGVAATACATCTAYETCQLGSCMNENTQCQQTCENGCCFGGDCKPYAFQDNSSCGTSGNLCAACAGGTNCDRTSGLCLSPTYCTNCTGADMCCDGSTCRPGSAQGYCGSNGGACDRCATLTTPCYFNSNVNRYVCQTSTQTCPNCTGINQCCANGTCQVGDGSTGYCGSSGLPCSNCTKDQCQMLDGRNQCVQTAERWRVCVEKIDVDCATNVDCNDTSDDDPRLKVNLAYNYFTTLGVDSPEVTYIPGQFFTHSFGSTVCQDGVSDSEVRDGIFLQLYEVEDLWPDERMEDAITRCEITPTSSELASGLLSRGCQSTITYTIRFIPQ